MMVTTDRACLYKYENDANDPDCKKQRGNLRAENYQAELRV